MVIRAQISQKLISMTYSRTNIVQLVGAMKVTKHQADEEPLSQDINGDITIDVKSSRLFCEPQVEYRAVVNSKFYLMKDGCPKACSFQ